MRAFTPAADWLSDLGDRLLDSHGAVLCRSAAVLAERGRRDLGKEAQ